jgi:hypothetical protein
LARVDRLKDARRPERDVQEDFGVDTALDEGVGDRVCQFARLLRSIRVVVRIDRTGDQRCEMARDPIGSRARVEFDDRRLDLR